MKNYLLLLRCPFDWVFYCFQRLFPLLLMMHVMAQEGCGQSSGIQAFKNHLGSNAPVLILRYSEIDCASGNQRHFLASKDNENFFLREYVPKENPETPISTNNIPQRPNFFGQYDGIVWQISGLQVSEASVVDPVVNVYKVQADHAKIALADVLNLGVPVVKRGTFVWTRETPLDGKIPFSAQLAPKFKMTRKSDGATLTNLAGWMNCTNDMVTEIHVFQRPVKYEYTTNLPVPYGIPTKIILGNSDVECTKMYLIHELIYGRDDNSNSIFNPLSKYVSTNNVSIVFITNGARRVIQGSTNLYRSRPTAAGTKPSNKQRIIRWLLAVAIIAPVGLIILYHRHRRT